jgi:hypothetical protein
LLEEVAQAPGLNTNHRIGRGIEIGILAEDVDGDGETFQAICLTGLLTLDEIAKKVARALRAAERIAG